MAEFKIGDKIRIRGDLTDDSVELDGKIGIVHDFKAKAIGVKIDGIDSLCWICDFNCKRITDNEGVESNG